MAHSESWFSKFRLKASNVTWAIALMVLLPLRDRGSWNIQAAYNHAHDLLIHGQLADSQTEAQLWYRRLEQRNADLATKFLLLEAEDLSKRGMYGDAERLVRTQFRPTGSPSETIEALAIEARALMEIARFSEAEEKLKIAGALCTTNLYSTCGSVLRDWGVLAVEQQNLPLAHDRLLHTLNFAHEHSDPWLETTVLLDLSWASSLDEHYDEALDWSKLAYEVAKEKHLEDLFQRASGNMGWAYFGLGDSDRALDLFSEAESTATKLGNIGNQITWLKTSAYVYRSYDQLAKAEQELLRALKLSESINDNSNSLAALEDLSHVAVERGDLTAADRYIPQAEAARQKSGSDIDEAYIRLAIGKLAMARRDNARAESLFQQVESDKASQVSMRFAAEHELALLYQEENQPVQAERMYRTALATFEGARQQLKDDDSKLPFVANAKGIYDDYVRFLVDQHKSDLALMTADQSRARTLAQGLGMMAGGKSFHPAAVSAQAVARKADATLLFYWLGERQSYLWAVTPRETALFPLPAEREIAPLVERYDRDLLGAEDPIEAGNAAGQQLYRMLVQPAEKLIGPSGRVMLLTDGPLSRLNFEALIVPGDKKALADAKEHKAHYWIEDATVSAAPSISMLAGGLAEHSNERQDNASLLLLGNPQSPSPDYPNLPYAGQEMVEIEKQFGNGSETVYTGPQATPQAYLDSKPERFPYIHFVSHGVASRTDPLDSAIILSHPGSGDEDSFKLYAREIMRHPIQARLVTISACYGSGTRTYTGEGLVGLSWAFLRAGAQRTIGALWEASDRSTPELMSTLYEGLKAGQTPAAALRNAKLTLLHSGGNFRKPFYWAAFQLYTRV